MAEGKKFRPVITRVKLNPEQAVLACCSIVGGKGQFNRATGYQCATRTSTTTCCNAARRNQLPLS